MLLLITKNDYTVPKSTEYSEIAPVFFAAIVDFRVFYPFLSMLEDFGDAV